MNERFENIKKTIYDNETNLSYILSLDWEVSLITRLLNELNDKNQLLEEEIEELDEMRMSEISFKELYEKQRNELYDFRLVLNALLFNEWAENKKYEVYKSRKHHNGEYCFNGKYFIVVAMLPYGQVTNHYHVKYWDMFKIPSYERVKDEYDKHTPTDVLLRYGLLLRSSHWRD